MDERTFWGWAIRGLEGCTNMISMLVEGGATLTPHFKRELDRVIERLVNIQQATDALVEE